MAQFQRVSAYALGFLSVSALTLLDSAPAASRAPSGWELLGSCSERVEELEAEVAVLRRQLATESRAAHARAHGSEDDEHESPRASSADDSPECAVAFEISEGIKRFKEQCVYALQSQDPCDVPYELNAAGVKRFKPDCLRSE